MRVFLPQKKKFSRMPVLKGEKVHLVEGDVTNIKITYPSDIRMAEAIMGGK